MRYAGVSASERRYLPPAVAVSVVAFALRPPRNATTGSGGLAAGETTIWVPLVRRTRAPFLGLWALPGGPTEWNETLGDTALRVLRAAVRCTPGTLEQLYSFGSVERSADAQRLVTIAYWALYGEHELDACDLGEPEPISSEGGHSQRGLPVPEPRRWDDPIPAPEAARDAADPNSADTGDDSDTNVAWFSADELPELAFDHAEIIAHALSRLRAKTEYASVAHRFLGPEFTLGQLRAVHEAVRGTPVDPANFRRQALAQGKLIDTGRYETGTPHRPARLYRFAVDPELEARSPNTQVARSR
ncbi:hypothetical protein G7067_13055 [Leucobacter insecticola]|uniref:NrtR DNA-binding winged helix domain-containing protein n=1 Tax=Leucobacter insecticola TaxID=2714934 RepID=A0A6G8FL80_9MICO|nr:NUDIX domain-containing protein [Leucobacter insecticola]QIM17125.1 hypothetical protein G7067_13055 [Leucobacter insecticola]